jgi:CheY-like chemotaxis protein
MQPESSKRKQFLILDDDPQFLATAASLLNAMSAGRWLIRTATNHSQAFEQLKADPVDAVVVDVEMPVMDGIEVLRLLGRSHPGQQVVMLAGRVDQTSRKTCMDLGATLYLEKPFSEEGFRSLFNALDSLTGVAPPTGFRGIMQRVGLEDILQMECLARKSSVLVISTGKRRGQIYICDGEIIHADSGRLQGEMALYGLLALTGGEFTFQPFVEPARRTISGQYQFLLMEAARLRDEAGSHAARQSGGAGRTSDLTAASVEAAAPTEARGVRTEELLLSSSAGEVLYQWQCQSIENRLELFKQLEQRAMQASRGMPSGRFQRVSMHTGLGSLHVQLQPTFKLLVRSVLPEQPPANE